MFAFIYSAWMKRLARYAILFILFFFVAHRFWFVQTGFIESATSVVCYPLMVAQRTIVQPIKQYLQNRASYNELQEEVNKLNQDRMALLEENIALHAQLEFVGKTKDLIEYAKRYTVDGARLVQVLAKHSGPDSNHILVNAGARHGIELDMVAVVKNCLVGRVTHVMPYWSKVILVTDKSCKVSAHCARSKAEGIYEGCGDCLGSLSYISHLESVAKNDLVLTSGKGLVFPHGFGIGYVESCSKEDLHYSIAVRPLIDFDDLEHCYLIKKGESGPG